MRKQIPEERKGVYSLGMVLIGAGVLLFLSTFVLGAMTFGDFSNFEGRARSSMMTSMVGMVLIILGSVLRAVGSRGLAGAGILLDPERAREEMEPHARMAGGMLKDALDEAGIRPGNARPEQVVMIKCPACGKLNDEDAKFCQECGRRF